MEWLCVRINFPFNLVFSLLLIILVNLPRSAIDPMADLLKLKKSGKHEFSNFIAAEGRKNGKLLV